MRSSVTSTLVLLLATLIPAGLRGDDGPMPHRFHRGQSAEGIAFELNSNKIFLPVRIGDGEPRWFVIDSGCPVTAVEMTLARDLHLPLTGQRGIAGAGEGRAAVAQTTVKSLSLPGLDLFPKAAWALGVNGPVAPFEGRRIDGLLGVDFLEQFVVRIDYPKRKLDIFSPEGFRPTGGGVVVPLEKVGGHHTVAATLRLKGGQSIDARFILDIGVRLPLLLSTPFVDRNHLIDTLRAGPKQVVGGGLGGETLAHLARVESLTVGGLKIDAPFVALSQEKRSFLAGDDTQGLLGAEVFRRYCLTLDFPGQRAIFTDTADTGTPYEYDASGMFLVARGGDLRHFEVLSVTEGGPAARAGLEAGDIIVDLDGRPTAGMTLEQVRAGFRQIGATRELKLRRHDQELTVKVVLQRVV